MKTFFLFFLFLLFTTIFTSCTTSYKLHYNSKGSGVFHFTDSIFTQKNTDIIYPK